MKNIQGLASGLSTEVDIVPVTITLPTAARTHAITSSSPKDNASAQAQVETATVVGTITTTGNATVTVTSAGMAGSPKAVSVAVVDGTAQIETATAVGTITGDGDAEVIVTGALVTGSPLTVPVTVSAGDAQVDTATIVGVMATAGDLDVIVTGANLAGSPLTVQVAVDAGVAQVNTATIVGTIGAAGAGNIDVIVTGTAIAGSPLTVPVAVANDDTASDVGGKVRAALGIAAITGGYAVSGATTDIILTGNSLTADDATLNIAYENGTATGLTEDATSVKTTAGSTTDDASAVATKIIAELGGTSAITDDYTMSGAGADVIITSDVIEANDATLNIAYENGTATGLTEDATSANTTAGAVADDADAVATLIRAALGIAAITDEYTVSGATDAIILTADTKAANDTTLNISIANGTATGITEDLTSADTAAGVAIDTDNSIATKIRAAMVSDAAIGHPTTGKFAISGATNKVIFTANTAADNDATLNIAVEDGTSVGITDDTTSDATAEGSDADGAASVIVEGIIGDYTEAKETVILSGATAVNTVNSYRFINEMYVNSPVTNVGVVTATAAVDATVSSTISAAAGESWQAYYMTPLNKSFVLEDIAVNVANATSDAITTLRIKVKEFGGAWRTKKNIAVIDSYVYDYLAADITLREKSIVKVTAVASAGTSTAGVAFNINNR